MQALNQGKEQNQAMIPSVAGVLISAALLAVVLLMRSGLLTGLLGSLAFGATAFAELSSLGGASPLIYVAFTAGLIALTFLRWDILRRLGAIFRNVTSAWIVFVFMVYSVLSAVLFPRLFTGDTTVFVASRVREGVFEIPLAPVSGNITQAGYLTLSCLAFFGVCLTLTRRFDLTDVKRGFFLFAWSNAILGLVDFAGKYGGAGDILAPIRSANYAMLTDVNFGTFQRIAGGFSEASAFGGVSLACLAFSYTYWRQRRTRQSFWLSLITLFLLLVSTSSTAYVGLGVLSIPVFLTIARQLLRKHVKRVDLAILVVLFMGTTGLMAISIVKPQVLAPAIDLIDSAVIKKVGSDSGQERAYWNYASLKSLVDTKGFGVGIGSSRASSWPIAVVSQLGVIGFVLIAMQVQLLLRGMRGIRGRFDPETGATLAGVRAAAIAGMISGSLISGSADPGIVFFIALAVISISRVYIKKNLDEMAPAAAGQPLRPYQAPYYP